MARSSQAIPEAELVRIEREAGVPFESGLRAYLLAPRGLLARRGIQLDNQGDTRLHGLLPALAGGGGMQIVGDPDGPQMVLMFDTDNGPSIGPVIGPDAIGPGIAVCWVGGEEVEIEPCFADLAAMQASIEGQAAARRRSPLQALYALLVNPAAQEAPRHINRLCRMGLLHDFQGGGVTVPGIQALEDAGFTVDGEQKRTASLLAHTSSGFRLNRAPGSMPASVGLEVEFVPGRWGNLDLVCGDQVVGSLCEESAIKGIARVVADGYPVTGRILEVCERMGTMDFHVGIRATHMATPG